MRKLIISFVLLFLLYSNSLAQGLYKVKYEVNSVSYDGLLVWYAAGQPFMRIRHYDPRSQGYLLVQQDVTSAIYQDQYILNGSNARYLSSVPQGYNYSPDNFIFQRILSTPYYQCVKVVDKDNRAGAFLEFRALASNEITPTLLERFGFSSTNDTTSVYRPNPNTTMHLIVVADTDDRNIGAGDAKDAEMIRREFEIAAREIGVYFSPTIVSGSGFGRNNVVNVISNLKPSANDIVVFVYTGHGFRFDNDDRDAYPRLSLARNRENPVDNNLAATAVYDALKKKGARLSLVIVDSCNSRIGLNKPEYDQGFALKPSDAGISRRAVATLFLNARGSMIIAAARRGEYAYSNSSIGGFFINSFLDAFMYETSIANTSSPSWQTIITNTYTYTYNRTNRRQTILYFTELR